MLDDLLAVAVGGGLDQYLFDLWPNQRTAQFAEEQLDAAGQDVDVFAPVQRVVFIIVNVVCKGNHFVILTRYLQHFDETDSNF